MTLLAIVGRESERRRIEAALAAGERAIVLVGPAGVGKSALAGATAGDLVVVDARVEARDDLLAALARAATVSPGAVDARVFLERLATALDQRSAIVVLDGAESARDVVRDAVLDLLDLTSTTRVIVTSRERLDLPDELVVSVRPLARSAAIELLEREVRRHAPEVVIAPDVADALAAKAGDRPLAIQLVAARVVAVGAERAFASLASPSDDALEHVLSSSWSSLDESVRRAAASLRVFRGGFDLAAAAAVLGPNARALLDSLVAASFVVRIDDDERYELRPLDAASTELDESVRERHADHFASIASARADDRASWSTLSRERENLLAAFRASTNNPVRAAKLAAVLDPILVTAGPAKLHEEVLTTALAALDGIDAPAETSDVAIALGRHHGLHGRHEAAAKLFERALALSLRAADEKRAGWAESFLAFSLRPLARFDVAARHGRSALARARRLDDARLEVMAEQTLGLVAFDREELKDAGESFRRALAVARNADAPRLEAIVLANLALLAHAQRDLTAAEAQAHGARVVFERIADRLHLARVAHVEALVAIEREDLSRAEGLLQSLLDTSLEHGDLDGELGARSGLARVAVARGDLRLASLRLDEARAVARRSDDVVERERLERLARRIESPRPRAVIVVARDARTIAIDGRVVDLSKRGPSRRLVLALAEHRLGLVHRGRRGLDVDAMLAAGWPGERMRAESGAARVYMAVRRLRELGLESVLRTDEDGYSIDADVDISWGDPER